MLLDKIKDRISNVNGKMGIYYLDLKSQEYCIIGNTDKFVSAGIAKLHVLVEVFKQLEEGVIKQDDTYILKNEDKVPSIGALTYIHEGIEVTIEDLYRLMVSVSDNTAFNILVNIVGIENINNTLNKLGFYDSRVNRKFFDKTAVNNGLENYYSIQEIAELLLRLYKKQLISNKASCDILDILKEQQRSYIIPYYFGEEISIAHQMGEGERTIHDVGIVYADRPFIICMGANDVDVKKTQNIMRDIAYLCYENSIK